jgi:hypothetical protein
MRKRNQGFGLCFRKAQQQATHKLFPGDRILVLVKRRNSTWKTEQGGAQVRTGTDDGRSRHVGRRWDGRDDQGQGQVKDEKKAQPPNSLGLVATLSGAGLGAGSNT